jgi:hypothetical protein
MWTGRCDRYVDGVPDCTANMATACSIPEANSVVTQAVIWVVCSPLQQPPASAHCGRYMARLPDYAEEERGYMSQQKNQRALQSQHI